MTVLQNVRQWNLIVLFFLGFSSYLSAQTAFGVKAGQSFFTEHYGREARSDSYERGWQNSLVFSAFMNYNYNIKNALFRTELNYLKKGLTGKYDSWFGPFDGNNFAVEIDETYYNHYLELLILKIESITQTNKIGLNVLYGLNVEYLIEGRTDYTITKIDGEVIQYSVN